MIPILREHTDAVIAALETAGLTVYNSGKVPQDPPVKYAVVFHINDTFSGSLEAPYEDADLVYQVTCIGREGPEQAEWVQDEVMAAMLAGVTVEGRAVTNVRPDSGPGVRPDRDTTPPEFFSTPRFTIKSTPDPLAVSA